jgi:acetoin utilization deacetylase AcuC-like enzyme
MKILYSSVHKLHIPQWEIINREAIPHAEVPERIEQIVKEFRENGLAENIKEPKKFPRKWIEQVHQKTYIDYIKNTAETIKKEDSFYPSYFIMDTYTPIRNATYEAAIESVNCALTGAASIEEEKKIYALCRPPGHHAETNVMGGYCYFNNAAIAAEYLSRTGTVAILDIDFHHGNGTQHIFYDRQDVFYISLHADPTVKFPFISGFANETGRGEGKGYNLNFPLPLGTGNKAYDQTLNKALSQIKKYRPDFLVVSCGFDTYEGDPIGGFKLTIPFYEIMAKQINELNVPTLIIQEGGYNVQDLGKIAYSFYKGFK